MQCNFLSLHLVYSAIVYDFEMTGYTVSESDGLVELSLRILSHSRIFCNITLNLTATNIEAGIFPLVLFSYHADGISHLSATIVGVALLALLVSLHILSRVFSCMFVAIMGNCISKGKKIVQLFDKRNG